MTFIVRGIIHDLQTHTGISQKGNRYTKTVVTIGGYPFSFFNLKENTLQRVFAERSVL